METLDQALERQSYEAKLAKADQWKEIQQLDPQLAVFLKQLASAFGKLKKVDVIYIE